MRATEFIVEGVAEGEVVPLGKKHRGDLDSINLCSRCGGKLEGGTYMGQRIKVCQPCKQVYLPPNSGIDQQGNKIKEQGVAEDLNELTNTSLKVKQPKDFVNTNDRKQVTWKVMKFKSGKDTYLINFTMQDPPTFGKKSKSNWNAVNVAFGVKEPQDEYSFGDEINTDLTARNKNQFLIYSTVINAVRKFITEYNTEIDEIIMQGAGERQQAMYQRFFQSAGKYFPGWHYNGKHSLVRDVPRQTGKKVREQGVAEGILEEDNQDPQTIVRNMIALEYFCKAKMYDAEFFGFKVGESYFVKNVYNSIEQFIEKHGVKGNQIINQTKSDVYEYLNSLSKNNYKEYQKTAQFMVEHHKKIINAFQQLSTERITGPGKSINQGVGGR